MKIPLVPSKKTRAAALLLVECAEIGENQAGESVSGVRLRHDRTCPPTRPRSGETDGPLQDPRVFRPLQGSLSPARLTNILGSGRQHCSRR